MSEAASVVWEFGGPLGGAPAETAMRILLVIGAAAALFAWFSYRTAVVRIGIAPTVLLVLLRTAGLLALLLCLANPVRVERETREPPPPPPPAPLPPIAVVVDRSDSMTTPDNRGRTRLDDALGNWRRIEKTAQAVFAPPRYYSFAEDLRPAATLEQAAVRTGATGETRLYRAVAEVLKQSDGERPAAIVVLTDGIDTSTDRDAMLRDAALAAAVPVYFVPGANRSARPEPFVRVREWRAPAVALRNSVFTLEASFEAFSRSDRNVPFSLWLGERRIETGRVALTTGANLVARSFTVNATEPGAMEFTLRLGEDARAPVVARSVTRVLERRATRVLVYQGALDWGFRYLTNALRTDPNFEFATIVTPDVGVSLVRDVRQGGRVVARLSEDAKALEVFDCIVLAQTYPQQLTPGQQRALLEFARQGGSLLFLSPNAAAIPQFATAPLAEVLPVRFNPAGGSAAAPARGRAERPGGGPMNELLPFELTEAGRASPIFAQGERGGQLRPRFAEFVPVTTAKPGAEVLAVHPSAREANSGAPYVLLAVHSFGRGRAAFLATDALWRWKMSESSESQVVETFWQQLILAIGRRREAEALEFANAPAQLRVGQAVTLRLGGVTGDKRPVVAAKSSAGATVTLAVRPAAESETGWSVEWTPTEPGAWEIAAAIEGAHRAHIFPNVVAEVTGELAPNPPALEAMRALAGETGGALLTNEAPAAWRAAAQPEKPPEPVVHERRSAEWNNWLALGAALGCFALELVFRRLWKLL